MKNEYVSDPAKQAPFVLWFTGLSGAGKSSIATLLHERLESLGLRVIYLDGDELRNGINSGLGFSEKDRMESVRRAGEVAKLFFRSGCIVLVAMISPYRSSRDKVRAHFAENEFLEVFVDTSLEECERRDPRGLYKKAREGTISNFTGLDSPYERPETCEIHLLATRIDLTRCVEAVIEELNTRHLLPS